MAAPTLSGLDAATFNENTVNATPQVIDSAVVFADADNNFNGGTLTVTGLLAEDTVSILSGLTISLSGGVVYYDADGAGAGAAVAIGTASGGVGATFTVTFNASATSAMIDTLIQNLTYANSSDTPTASRTLALNVTDATGAYLSSSATPTLTLQNGAANPWSAVTTTGRSAPTFGDLDGDGDKDLIVGQSNGTFKYFLNTGTATSPVFEERTGANNPLNGVSVTISAKPALGDMDGDGDLDLIVTNKNGLFSYFLNTGTAAAPTFTAQTGGANPLSAFSAGTYASPTLGDIDGDGDLDLFVGQELGTLRYFRNTGSAAAPAFTEITGVSNPGSVITGGTFQTNWAAPALVDLNGDGDLDLIIGNTPGTFRYFENTGTTASPTYVERTGSNNPLNGVQLNFGSNPTFVDIDGDGDQDLVSGDSNSGILTYFQNTTSLGMTFTVNVTAEDDGPTPTSGADVLTFGAGSDTVDGGDGDDVIDGGAGDDSLVGGAGADYIKGGLGADAMTGGTGNDTYVVDNAGDTTDETGGDGIDLVIARVSWTLGAGLDNLTLGNAGALSGTGNALDNVIIGNSSGNTLNGMAGADTLNGGGGDDILNGGDDNDVLDGGMQNDTLDGGSGDDTLAGGGGHDRLSGGLGADTMRGGVGNDTYVVENANDVVDETGGGGDDVVISRVSWILSDGVETLKLGNGGAINGTGNALGNTITGNSSANTLNGLAGDDALNGAGGDDILNGGDDDDTLDGGAQNDALNGGAGNDKLSGGAGHDRLDGGAGADRMTGGAGADTFVFTDADVQRSGPGFGLVADRDVILDLGFATNDRIDLSAIDANVNLANDQAFTFVSNFTGTAGEATLKFVNGKSVLQLDVDGDGAADLVVEINGNVTGTTANLYTGGGDLNGGWVL